MKIHDVRDLQKRNAMVWKKKKKKNAYNFIVSYRVAHLSTRVRNPRQRVPPIKDRTSLKNWRSERFFGFDSARTTVERNFHRQWPRISREGVSHGQCVTTVKVVSSPSLLPLLLLLPVGERKLRIIRRAYAGRSLPIRDKESMDPELVYNGVPA